MNWPINRPIQQHWSLSAPQWDHSRWKSFFTPVMLFSKLNVHFGDMLNLKIQCFIIKVKTIQRGDLSHALVYTTTMTHSCCRNDLYQWSCLAETSVRSTGKLCICIIQSMYFWIQVYKKYIYNFKISFTDLDAGYPNTVGPPIIELSPVILFSKLN